MREARTRQKEKSRPSRACKGKVLKSGLASMENRIILLSEDGFGVG